MLSYLNDFLDLYASFFSSDYFTIFGYAAFCLAMLTFLIKVVYYIVRFD